MKVHPAAELFPLMEGPDFDRLVESIRSGFDKLQPIVVDRDGRIIDGRNRARACEAAGVRPLSVAYEGDDPYGEAVRLNIVRRHLTPSQIAAVLVKSARLRQAQADAKKRQGNRTDLNIRSRGTECFNGEATGGRAVDAVAKEYGIGASTLKRAQVVDREAPELLPKVLSGDLTVREAQRQAARDKIVAPKSNVVPLRTDPPMPTGMKRSPRRPGSEVCERAATQILNAVEVAKTLPWESIDPDKRSALRADLQAARHTLSDIIRQTQGGAGA